MLLINLMTLDFFQLFHRLVAFLLRFASSGAFEDLEGASFAGMYESYLNVSTLEELKAKIHLCFESATSERIQQYASENLTDVDSETLKNNLFVLIQKMAPAKLRVWRLESIRYQGSMMKS